LTIQNPVRCSTITHITLLPVLDVGNPRNQLLHLVDAEVVNVDDDGLTKDEDEVVYPVFRMITKFFISRKG